MLWTLSCIFREMDFISFFIITAYINKKFPIVFYNFSINDIIMIYNKLYFFNFDINIVVAGRKNLILIKVFIIELILF